MNSLAKTYLENSAKTMKEIKILTVILLVTGVFFALSTFSLINIYAQTENDPVTSINNLVVTISTFIATLGIIAGVAHRIIKKLAGQKVYTDEFLGQVVSTLEKAESSLEATDRGIKDNLDIVGLVTNTIFRNEKIKEIVGREDSQKIIHLVEKEIQAWTEDLIKYYETIDPKLDTSKTVNQNRLATVEAKLVPT